MRAIAGFQELYQHPATVEDVRRYPSVGRNAYNEEEVRWFEATYDYLEAQRNSENHFPLPFLQPLRVGEEDLGKWV